MKNPMPAVDYDLAVPQADVKSPALWTVNSVWPELHTNHAGIWSAQIF